MPQPGLEERIRSVAQDVPPEAKEAAKPVDREKTCPLLLRVFVSDNGRHHRLDEFNTRGNVPTNELQIYTWMDANLKELTSLVKEVRADARKKGTVFHFATVFMERSARYRMKDIGQTVAGLKGPDDGISLGNQKFQIGDYIDIAITLPREQRRMQY